MGREWAGVHVSESCFFTLQSSKWKIASVRHVTGKCQQLWRINLAGNVCKVNPVAVCHIKINVRAAVNHSKFYSLCRSNPPPALDTFMDFLTLEDGTDRSSRNVNKEFPTLRCIMPQKRADLIYCTSRRKPEITHCTKVDGKKWWSVKLVICPWFLRVLRVNVEKESQNTSLPLLRQSTSSVRPSSHSLLAVTYFRVLQSAVECSICCPLLSSSFVCKCNHWP